MEIFFRVEVESRFLSEHSRDGANGCAALRSLHCDAPPASMENQDPRSAERHTQLGLYSYLCALYSAAD